MYVLRRPIASIAIVACAAFLLAGCSDDIGARDTTTSSLDSSTTFPVTTTTPNVTTTSLTTTTTAADETVDPVGDPDTKAFQTEGFPGSGETAHLTDVRVGDHGAFERLVFEFADGPTPEYRVEYVSPPILESPSGNEIEVPGDAFLSITMSPATGFEVIGDDLVPTYEGPERIQAETASYIRLVAQTEDFEDVTAWVVGLDEALPFGTAGRDDPARLVIDFRTG